MRCFKAREELAYHPNIWRRFGGMRKPVAKERMPIIRTRAFAAANEVILTTWRS